MSHCRGSSGKKNKAENNDKMEFVKNKRQEAILKKPLHNVINLSPTKMHKYLNWVCMNIIDKNRKTGIYI